MNLKSVFPPIAVFGVFSAFSGVAYGVQFTASSDVCTEANCPSISSAASYTGASAGTSIIFSASHPTTDLRGAVRDGGNDAFDFFGYVANVGSLSLNRQTELLSGNIYRFFDTYTNNTGGTIDTTITFVGDLGSDSGTVYENVNSYRQVSSDGGPGDPIVGFLWGNNAFAASMVRSTGQGGNSGPNERTAIAANLSLAAGQSVSLIYFAFLADDLTDRSGDAALALSTVNALFDNPNLGGLTSQQLARALNWSPFVVGEGAATPEPSTALMTGFGLVALAALRRRSR